jgi:hypothetical protein
MVAQTFCDIYFMKKRHQISIYKQFSDASYQVSVHLAEGFQRRLKCEKITDDRRRTPSDGKSSRCLWQGELKMEMKNKMS